jgi:serine/threonine-protein kinase
MRFIRGRTLEQSIAELHGPDGPDGRGPRALALRALLRRFLDVCNAIEYAHLRGGVIHRDLKPKNIMLGPHGETLVVDWGLAKPVGRPEGAAPGEAEETIRRSSSSGYDASRYGQLKGTVAYMSPEQAEGRVDELGRPSDVYALGAILYEILTGHRAFAGRSKDDLLTLVIAGTFPRPREVAPAVPKPLEAICLKAMKLRPEDRYASAQALADDVERWLADEPVSAYPEPLPARTARWLRHHRTAAVAAGVLLVVSTAALAVDDVRVSRERTETTKALVEKAKALVLARSESDRAESQRAAAVAEHGRADSERKQAVAARNRASVGLGLAMGAIDEIEEVVASPTLTTSAEEDRLRLKLALIALDLYEKLLAADPGNGRVRFRVARVAREAANLGRLAGQFDAPLQQYLLSIKRFEELEARAPRDPAYPFGLASTLKELGELYRMNGKVRDAEEALRRALDALGRASVRAEDEPTKRRELGVIRINLAVVHVARGNYPAARRSADEAVEAVERPARSSDKDRMYLVMALTTRGHVARVAKDPVAAQESLDRADREVRTLLTKEDGHRDYRYLLASACVEHGRLLALDPARRAAALADFDEAIRFLEPLAKTFPHVAFYTRSLAEAFDGRGATLLDDGRTDPAARDCRAARDLLEGLLKAHNLPTDHTELGRTLGDLGRIARAEGKPDEAAALLDRAVAEQRAALAGNPESLFDRELLDRHRADLDALGRGK